MFAVRDSIMKAARGTIAMAYVHAHPIRDPVLEEKRYSLNEELLEYRGRKVLYQYAEASNVTFCTGTGVSWLGSMSVKGYVVRWRYGTNEKGEALSEIEPITDPVEQREIRVLLWPGTNDASRVSFQNAG
jgi:hypothetical protein